MVESLGNFIIFKSINCYILLITKIMFYTAHNKMPENAHLLKYKTVYIFILSGSLKFIQLDTPV